MCRGWLRVGAVSGNGRREAEVPVCLHFVILSLLSPVFISPSPLSLSESLTVSGCRVLPGERPSLQSQTKSPLESQNRKTSAMCVRVTLAHHSSAQ